MPKIQAARLMLSLRLFSCPQLGGHLHGDEHRATCGGCGAKVGHGDRNRGETESSHAVLHPFVCNSREMKELRQQTGVKKPKAMWAEGKAKNTAVLNFFARAAALSRGGSFATGETPNIWGKDWTWKGKVDDEEGSPPADASTTDARSETEDDGRDDSEEEGPY